MRGERELRVGGGKGGELNEREKCEQRRGVCRSKGWWGEEGGGVEKERCAALTFSRHLMTVVNSLTRNLPHTDRHKILNLFFLLFFSDQRQMVSVQKCQQLLVSF